MTDRAQLPLFVESSKTSSDAHGRTSCDSRTSSTPTNPDATSRTKSAKGTSTRVTAEGVERSSTGAPITTASVQLPLLSTRTSPRAPDPYLLIRRPKTRGECQNEARPCPWIGCRNHLLIEVALAKHPRKPTSLRLNARTSGGGRRPGLLWSSAAVLVRAWIDDAMEQLAVKHYTCSLDVVDDYPDGLSARQVGKLFGVSKQAIEAEEKHPACVQALEHLREYISDE